MILDSKKGVVKVYLKNLLKTLFMECVSVFHNSSLPIYLGWVTLELLNKMLNKQASLSLHMFKHWLRCKRNIRWTIDENELYYS